MRIFIRNGRQLTRLTVVAASIALFAAIAFLVVPSGRAGVAATVTIESTVVQPGGSVSVSVDASVSPESLGAATIAVNYDPAVLDATSCTTSGSFNSGFCNAAFDNDGVAPDSARFTVASISGLTGNIHLADITFQGVGQPGDASNLELAISVFADLSGSPIPVSTQDGAINIPATPTPSPTPSPTPLPTPTPTATPTPPPTPTPGPQTPTLTATDTTAPSPTATPTATPTPTGTVRGATETPFATPTATDAPGTQVAWGDADCDSNVGTRDSQAILRNVLEQPALSQTPPCLEIGEAITVVGYDGGKWADWDCDGTVGTRDSQALLRNVLEQPALSQTQPCPLLGAEVTVTE